MGSDSRERGHGDLRMLLVTAGMQSWHRATLGLLPTSLQPQEHLDISVGAVVSPRCFYRMRRGLLQEAGLCSSSWSWEDPEGSRRRDDPSCASDPDWDIFKQGIKIDSGWQRALDPGITVKGLGGGQGGPQPLTPSSPPLTPHPGRSILACSQGGFCVTTCPWGLSPCPGHPPDPADARVVLWGCSAPRKCSLMHWERTQAVLAPDPAGKGICFS